MECRRPSLGSHHVQEEEDEAFPKLRNDVDNAELDSLGNTLMEMKARSGVLVADLETASKDELLEMARDANVEGRSTMTSEELRTALGGS